MPGVRGPRPAPRFSAPQEARVNCGPSTQGTESAKPTAQPQTGGPSPFSLVSSHVLGGQCHSRLTHTGSV